MNKKRDQFLTEAMGYVWHECQDNPDGFYCYDCANGLEHTEPFNTWDGFGSLIIWLRTQDLWTKAKWNLPITEIMDLIDPDKLADRAYEYLKDKK